MTINLRHALFALTTSVGLLALTACKTTDETAAMPSAESAPATSISLRGGTISVTRSRISRSGYLRLS